MTRQGLKQSWWLIAIALLVTGLGVWSLIQGISDGEGIVFGGGVVVLAISYLLWIGGLSLWKGASMTHDEESKKEEQNGTKL